MLGFYELTLFQRDKENNTQFEKKSFIRFESSLLQALGLVVEEDKPHKFQ
jgi:hypothetical protein